MNTGFSAPTPFEIDKGTSKCQNYKYGVQTQAVSAFGGVSAADREVGSNLCPDEKGTESLLDRKIGFLLISVATYAPMKRGLKVLTCAVC